MILWFSRDKKANAIWPYRYSLHSLSTTYKKNLLSPELKFDRCLQQQTIFCDWVWKWYEEIEVEIILNYTPTCIFLLKAEASVRHQNVCLTYFRNAYRARRMGLYGNPTILRSGRNFWAYEWLIMKVWVSKYKRCMHLCLPVSFRQSLD
jgi:hypothetical protein